MINDMHSDICRKLSKLQMLLDKKRLAKKAEKGPLADDTRGQGRVLAMLRMQPKISTSDLAFLLGIRPQSLNELLVKLENSEYIERKPSEEDGRVTMVSLTEKGKEVEVGKCDCNEVFKSLTDEERKNFEEYLDKINASLCEELGEVTEEEIEEWMKNQKKEKGKKEEMNGKGKGKGGHRYGKMRNEAKKGKGSGEEHKHGKPEDKGMEKGKSEGKGKGKGRGKGKEGKEEKGGC